MNTDILIMLITFSGLAYFLGAMVGKREGYLQGLRSAALAVRLSQASEDDTSRDSAS